MKKIYYDSGVMPLMEIIFENLNLADQVYGILLVIHDKCRPLAIS